MGQYAGSDWRQALADALVLCGLAGMLGCATAVAAPADPSLIGHWRLHGDCLDSSGRGHHGTSCGAALASGAAAFDGAGGHIVVPAHPDLALGRGDFTLSVWVRCAPGAGDTGDIVTQYDPDRRRGLNLTITASAPGYSSVSDARNLLFGIDDGVVGEWVDCGRPLPDNPLISTLIVYKGDLYTGTADATDPRDACHVYRYAGGKEWVDCGRVSPDLGTPSIYSVVVHEGGLYVGTGAWDWEKAWTGDTGPNHVYRYEGGTTWHDCGQFGEGYRVMSLASYQGKLYAADDKQRVYRFDGDGRWTECGRIEAGTKFHGMMVHNGALWGASNTTIHRFDGQSEWPIVGQFDPEQINQIHTLGVYGGDLYAGTWPVGHVLRYRGANDWAECGVLGIPTDTFKINEVNELTAYNGKLYAGVIPLAEVWRYERGTEWTMLKRLVNNPGYRGDALPTWMRVPCLTVFRGRIYAGTSTCQARTSNADFTTDAGKVFSWQAGQCVSFDDDLGTAWRHVVCVRDGGRLRLCVDGERVAESEPSGVNRLDLSNGRPLLIGLGPAGFFRGQIRDVRLYNRALPAASISNLTRREASAE